MIFPISLNKPHRNLQSTFGFDIVRQKNYLYKIFINGKISLKRLVIFKFTY